MSFKRFKTINDKNINNKIKNMKIKLFFFFLSILSVFSLQSQNMIKIHQSNGTTLELPLYDIDSITYLIPGSIVTNPGQGVIFNGYTYTSFVLGNGQEWMAENLRTTNYANGDIIPNVTVPIEWKFLTTGAWVHYNNDSLYENTNGKLYNWYAVVDQRKLCPSGWHVPTDAEFTLLTDYLGGEAVAGDKMKSTGNQYWLNQNQGATNISGFSGLPSGICDDQGNFSLLGSSGAWWSSSSYDDPSTIFLGAWLYALTDIYTIISRTIHSKTQGYSIRCLKD